ncbi:hypothetical protein [Photobacterium indicum]|uniref:Uncharacterized protein n=1 Tax=Photobacterium indicum TaxID=81447 RepID=A0A2T3L8L5_9GAMM|nr:hypothetical protein [Photobacterium indicum]PSV47328.1 hypothetical protein C9J47_10640 [Photobacterium indicum]
MSQKLTLALYQSEGDRLNERGVERIDSVAAPDAILNMLANEFEIISTKVYFAPDSDKSFTIDHFRNEDVAKIILKLECTYKDLVIKQNDDLSSKGGNKAPSGDECFAVELYDAVCDGAQTLKDSITVMITFLNVLNLFYKKQRDFEDDDYAFIKVDG